MSFLDDIKGQNTQLYPIITIEPPDTYTGVAVYDWRDDLARCKFFSTNNVSLDHIHSEYFPGDKDVVNLHFKPLLLNIPSIKESIDIESRKFKISSVNLDISNYEYEGERFSDILADTSLINWLVSIQFVSPTANKFSTIFGLSDGSWAGTSMYQAYSETYQSFFSPSDYFQSVIDAGKHKMTQMVYQGVIRRISHDDTKVRVELEDLTEQKSHKNLPLDKYPDGRKGHLGAGNDVPDKFKGKPIPMCYGHVEKSPVVLENDKEEGVVTVYLDSAEISGCDETDSHPLKIFGDDKYSSVLSTSNLITSMGYGVTTQYIVETFSNTINFKSPIEFIDEDEEAYSPILDDKLALLNESPPDNLKLFTSEDNSSDTFFEAINRGDTVKLGTSNTGGTDGFGEQWNYYEHFLWSNPPEYSDLANTYISYKVGFSLTLEDISGVTEENLSDNNPPTFYMTIGHLGYEHPIFIKEWRQLVDLSLSVPFGSTFQDEFDNENISSVDIGESEEGSSRLRFENYAYPLTDFDYEGDFTIDIDLPLRAIVYLSEKVISKDFYANVNGRVNANSILIENPIDIIRDLVRSELGHNAIDWAEYAEAKAAHADWKFGFTINKKINSKKLIEDIAKSTKCFPKFKNDGTFGFNTIKNTYTFPSGTLGTDNDYSSAKVIKDSEVISYSFKKTPPEQIYKKVTVSYHKDYAQDSYLKTTDDPENPDLYDEGADPFYGIESSNDAHLEFESDYIRHDYSGEQTADALAKFLIAQHKNDHLLMNLKLPLQYIGYEVGDIIKFDALLGGVKPYGIDYTTIEEPNGQDYFPLFMITSTKKNIDSVQIECMQLHNLDPSYDFTEADLESGIVVGINAPEVINLIQEYTLGNVFASVLSVSQYGLGNITAIDPADTVRVTILEERLYIPQNINISNSTFGYGGWHADNFFQDLGLDGWEDSHYRYKLRQDKVLIDDLSSYTPSYLTGSDNTLNYTETYYDEDVWEANLEVQGETYLVALYVCYEVEDNISVQDDVSIPSNNINNYVDNLRATTEANDDIVGDNWNNILGYTGSYEIWKVPSGDRIPDSQIATKIFILPETTTLRIDDSKEEVVELESTDLLRLKDINSW